VKRKVIWMRRFLYGVCTVMVFTLSVALSRDRDAVSDQTLALVRGGDIIRMGQCMALPTGHCHECQGNAPPYYYCQDPTLNLACQGEDNLCKFFTLTHTCQSCQKCLQKDSNGFCQICAPTNPGEYVRLVGRCTNL
jgi:hypothetical protein